MAKKDNQKKFLEAYEKAFGNLTQACKAADINRGTYYSWRNNDPAFCERMAAMEPEEMFVDFAEHALAKKIQGGDTTAIIFALKTKGKKRGYIEKTEQEVTVNKIEVEFIES